MNKNYRDGSPEACNNDILGVEKMSQSNDNENMTNPSEAIKELVSDVFKSAEMFPISKDENIVELTQEDYNILIHSLIEYKNLVEKQAKRISELENSFANLKQKIDNLSATVDQRVAEENSFNEGIVVESFETIDTTELVKEDRKQLFK